MNQSPRWNNLQICPCHDSNMGDSDLWSITLTLDHEGALTIFQGIILQHTDNDHTFVSDTVQQLYFLYGRGILLFGEENALYFICHQLTADNVGTTISVWARRNLTRGKWFKMAQKLMLKRNYNPRQSRLDSADVTSEHFSFLLPAFESGSGADIMGGPPVIWIISLYLG